MADEQIVTNIVANADFSSLTSDLRRVTAQLATLQEQANATNKSLANQIAVMNRQFGDTLRSTGQFTSHFVTIGSDVDKFGKNLDAGRGKLKDFYGAWQGYHKQAGGLIRDLAKQQVQLQNSVLQPLGRNADGMMKFAVHVPQGLDTIKNKTSLAKQELMIMNKVVQEGANQLINWGKNTQWAGRQLTVGLTVPIAAFGKAAADAFRQADEELTRLTKVYGDLSQTSSANLKQVRKDVSDTAKELASSMGASYNQTLALSADIAATGKTGNELLGSIKETTRLSILGEVDRQEAMKATLAIQSAFKQNTDELSQSINFLNAVENQTSTSLADLVEAIPKAGPVVKGLGGSIKDLALYLTAMREGGISASEGANALKSGLASLINPTNVAVSQFKTFGIDLLGIVNNNAGNVTGTLLELQKALDTLDPLSKQQAIEQLFGKFQFSRMNALFENLGKSGSQTMKVLELMKASSSDLADIAGRELSQVTESASGKYKRALEELKADLASTGEQFLKISTFIIKFIDRIIEFGNNLPGPIKTILGFFGGLTAVAGPLIMLTGVLGNFFGYIVKGVSHFKSLFKGAEGWKLLTPEIVAANSAGDLAEKTFYSDAKAAQVLNQALRDLTAQYDALATRAQSGAVSVSPLLGAIGNQTMGVSRVVDPTNPLAGAEGTRASGHMVPRKTSQPGSIFGLVPTAIPVNAAIGENPMIYANGDLPSAPGLTSISATRTIDGQKRTIPVSTGIVAGEAAKHHAYMAALSMQSKQEIEILKKTIATTGAASQEFMATFDDILPITAKITNNAAAESAKIVSELKAGQLTVAAAREKIIALNIAVERELGTAVSAYAASTGRTANIMQVPTLNQPVQSPTGKSNMRELFKLRQGGFFNTLGSLLGVRTSGAGYNVQTTIPKKLNSGGYIYTANDGSIVPGPNINADIVPAILTPGEFVVNAKATAENLPLLEQINGGKGSSGPGHLTGGQIQSLLRMPDEFLSRINLISGVRRVKDRSVRRVFSPGATNYDEMRLGRTRNSMWTNPALLAGKPGSNEVVGHIYSNDFYRKYGTANRGSSPRATSSEFNSLTGLTIPSSRSGYTGTYDILPNQLFTISKSFNTKLNKGGATPADWFKDPRKPEHLISLIDFLVSQGIPQRKATGIAGSVLNRINANIGKLPANAVISERMFGNIVTNSSRKEMMKLRSIGELNVRNDEHKPFFERNSYTPGAYARYNSPSARNRGGIVGLNSGGRVPGYNRGSRVGKSTNVSAGMGTRAGNADRGRHYQQTFEFPQTPYLNIRNDVLNGLENSLLKSVSVLNNGYTRLGVEFTHMQTATVSGLTKAGNAVKAGATSMSSSVTTAANALTVAFNAAKTKIAANGGIGGSLVKGGWWPTQLTKGGMKGKFTGTGFGSQMIGSTAGMAVGQAVGGNTGALVGSIGGSFLPQLIGKIGPFITKMGGLSKIVLSIGKFLRAWSIPGAILTAVMFLGKKIWDAHKAAEALGKANRMEFGGTAKSFASVGIKNYKTLSDRLKDVNRQMELHRAKVLSTYNSYTKGGPTGVTLTITQLDKAIKNAKKNQEEYVNNFNSIDKSRVENYAASLKAQFVAMGMSAEEASNKIYAIIKASDKSNQAVAAVSTNAFRSIQKNTDGIKFLAVALRKEINSDSFNVEEFASGMDTLLNTLMNYQSTITGTVDKTGELTGTVGATVDEADALAATMKQISAVSGTNKELSSEQLSQLKDQDIMYGSILGKTESLQSATAKILMYQAGLGAVVDLSKMGKQEAIDFANNLTVVQNAFNAITESTTDINPLKGLAGLIKKAEAEKTSAVAAAKKAKAADQDYYNNKFKLIDKEISKIKDQAAARIKLLEIEQQSVNYKDELRKAKLAYEQALASGDMVAAAEAQANVSKLMQDRQRALTIQNIQDRAEEKVKKEEERRQKLQDEMDKLNSQYNKIQANAATKTAELSQLQYFRDQLEAISLRARANGGTLSSVDKADVSNIIRDMQAAGGSVKKEADRLLKENAATSTYEGGGKVKTTSFEQNLINSLNDALSNTGNDVFDAAVNKFDAAVAKFAGKTNSQQKAPTVTTVSRGEYSASYVTTAALKAAGDKTTVGSTFIDDKGSEYKITNIVEGRAYVESTSKPSTPKKYTPTKIPISQRNAGQDAYFYVDPYDLKKNNVKRVKGTTFIDNEGNKWEITDTSNSSGYGYSVQRVTEYSQGGPVFGAGTSTSDSIPAMLSNGEYVINAKAVRNVGMPMLDNINRMAAGGLITSPYGQQVADMLRSTSGYAGAVNNNSYGGNITISPVIHAAPGMDENMIADIATRKMLKALEQSKTVSDLRVGTSRVITSR